MNVIQGSCLHNKSWGLKETDIDLFDKSLKALKTSNKGLEKGRLSQCFADNCFYRSVNGQNQRCSLWFQVYFVADIKYNHSESILHTV